MNQPQENEQAEPRLIMPLKLSQEMIFPVIFAEPGAPAF